MNVSRFAATLAGAVLLSLFAAGARASLVTVYWNPGTSHPGSTDPFNGLTTDSNLALPGDISYVGLTNASNTLSLIYASVPSSFQDDHYLQFSITPAAGQQLDLHELIVEAADQGSALPISPSKLIMRTSYDNFTNDIVPVTGPNSLKGNTGGPLVYDLESMPTLTGPLTLRLYPYGMSNNKLQIPGSVVTAGQGIWFADVDATPIPEPTGAVVLVAMSSLALIVRKTKSSNHD